MRTITWNLETGFVGGDREGTLEVEDDASEEEIDALVREEVFNYISWGWSAEPPLVAPQEQQK